MDSKSQTTASQSTLPLVGTWRLVSVTVETDTDTLHPMGHTPIGTLIYADNNRFSVQLMPSGRSHCAANDLFNATDEEIVANARYVVSYFGHFECDMDEGIVVHHIEGSLFPNWEGASLKRNLSLEADRLTLKSEPMSVGGKEAVAVIEWQIQE